jgi:hypothetical protein
LLWTLPTLASRDAFAKTPPSGEEICCPARFLGDSCHLGCNPGLDGRAKSREIVGDLRTILGRNFSHLSESRSGLIIGDFTFFCFLSRRSRAQGLCKSYRNFLSRCSFCLGGIPGLFFRDGCVIGLSGLFRSPWIPLGISVEDHALEIMGLESELGLIMGEFARRSDVCWHFLTILAGGPRSVCRTCMRKRRIWFYS